MKVVAIVAVIFTLVVGVFYITSDREESRILNAFAEQDMGVPEWIEIKWSSEHAKGKDYQIKYGLGGRTCNSIVAFDLNNHMTENARKCDF